MPRLRTSRKSPSKKGPFACSSDADIGSPVPARAVKEGCGQDLPRVGAVYEIFMRMKEGDSPWQI